MIPYALAEQIRTTRLRLNDPAARPLPEVTVDTGPTLPGWALRATLLVLVPLLVLTAASRTPALLDQLVWSITLLSTGLAVARPTPATAGGITIVSAVLLWGFTTEPFDPWALVVTLLAYLVNRTTWWAAHVPLHGRTEIAALLTGWHRDATVLAGTGLLGGLALLTTGATLPGTVLLAALAVLGAAFVALATGSRARDDGPDRPM